MYAIDADDLSTRNDKKILSGEKRPFILNFGKNKKNWHKKRTKNRPGRFFEYTDDNMLMR